MTSSRPIFVTGTSSGIGRDIIETLATRGHPVFATARKEADLQALAAIPNVIPVLLDVRYPDQVAAAAEIVRRSGLGLYGLVNNAGVGDLGFCSTWTDDELRDIFETNVFGPFRLTNALLPQLVEAHGRMVLVGSQGGMISKRLYGPYTMTKHALEAYSVALRDELEPYGVQVSIVQPGGVATAIGANSFPGILARLKRAEPPFKEEADAILASFDSPPPEASAGDEPESESNRKPSPPALVTAAVMKALFSDKPKLRYMVGTQWEGDRVIHALIEKLIEENDNPAHQYSREQLIAILDRKIAEYHTGD